MRENLQRFNAVAAECGLIGAGSRYPVQTSPNQRRDSVRAHSVSMRSSRGVRTRASVQWYGVFGIIIRGNVASGNPNPLLHGQVAHTLTDILASVISLLMRWLCQCRWRQSRQIDYIIDFVLSRKCISFLQMALFWPHASPALPGCYITRGVCPQAPRPSPVHHLSHLTARCPPSVRDVLRTSSRLG